MRAMTEAVFEVRFWICVVRLLPLPISPTMLICGSS